MYIIKPQTNKKMSEEIFNGDLNSSKRTRTSDENERDRESNELGNSNPVRACRKTQSIQSKNWIFTLNNYNEDEESKIHMFLDESCKWGIVGREIAPTTGTPHLQGAFSLISKKRRETLSQIPFFKRAHFERMQGEKSDQDIYCGKGENVYRKGFPAPLNILKSEQLYPWQIRIRDIILSEPDDRKVYWFWESTGNIGKSTFTKYLAYNYKCLFTNGGKMSDIVNLVFNADMDECRCIIWDLPRVVGNHISYGAIECAKNGMICNTKFETGVKLFNSPHIIVFCNFPPEVNDSLSMDRLIVEELG